MAILKSFLISSTNKTGINFKRRIHKGGDGKYYTLCSEMEGNKRINVSKTKMMVFETEEIMMYCTILTEGEKVGHMTELVYL